MLGLCTDGEVGIDTGDGEGTEMVGGPGRESEPVRETEMEGVPPVGESIDEEDEDVIGMDDGEEMDVLSGIVLRRRTSGDVTADALGRRKDVSKDVSGPSGNAMDCTDGDAARTEDS